jgi:hypothetical protein
VASPAVLDDSNRALVAGDDQRRALYHRERKGSKMCSRIKDGEGRLLDLTREAEVAMMSASNSVALAMGHGHTTEGESGLARARFEEETVSRGTKVVAMTIALLKGARWGKKEGGWSDGVHMEGGGWGRGRQQRATSVALVGMRQGY